MAVRHSVVELALARLVDEAALMLGPTWTALPGAVLPLYHLGAQRMALGPLPGTLQPPRLACLLQQHCPRREGSGGVMQGPGLAAGRCQLSVTMGLGVGEGGQNAGTLASPTLSSATLPWLSAISAEWGA